MVFTTEEYGQLGNRLFLYASGMSLAESIGQRHFDLSLKEYAYYFPGTRPWLPSWLYLPLRKLTRRLIRLLILNPVGRPCCLTLSTRDPINNSTNNPAVVTAARSRKVTFISGFPDISAIVLHSPKVIEALRHRFRPEPEIRDLVEKHVGAARKDVDVLIGVHLRRGDYERHHEGIFYYSLDFYRQVMERVQSFFPNRNVAFLICSNEPLQPDFFVPMKSIPGPGTTLGDLYGLAACDYIVGPPSTFSAWSAFQGNKPIHILSRPELPSGLSDFTIPNGHFKCHPSRTEIGRLRELRRKV